MLTDVTKRLFSVDEYYRMADAGILTEFDRVELIDGEIIEMSPIGFRHAECVNRGPPEVDSRPILHFPVRSRFRRWLFRKPSSDWKTFLAKCRDDILS